MTEKPTAADLSPQGEILMCYRHGGKAYISPATIDHNWMTGDFTSFDKNVSRVIMFGWLPGKGSTSLLEELYQSLVAQSLPKPDEQKRKIRIDEDVPDIK